MSNYKVIQLKDRSVEDVVATFSKERYHPKEIVVHPSVEVSLPDIVIKRNKGCLKGEVWVLYQ